MRLTRAGRWAVALVVCAAGELALGWVYLVAGPWLRGER